MAPDLLRFATMNFPLLRFLLPFLLSWQACKAAEISIPGSAVTTGQLIATTATLATEGAQIAGLQFDLEWDAGLSVQIVAGSGLASSGKLLYSAQLAPRSTRILIVGFNQASLLDGELLRLFVVAGSPGGSQLRLTNMVGATPDGDAIAIRGLATTFRIDPGPSGPALLSESVLNAASLRNGPIAPGEIVTLLGAFGITPDSSPGIVATVNGIAASVLYASGNQINTVVPWGLDAAKPAELAIRSQKSQFAQVIVPMAAASPALFTQNGAGIGPGAILNEDYSPNSTSNPAPAGSVVMMYGTGFGLLNPPGKDGQAGVLSTTTLPVSAKIAGVQAEVLYSGAAPGLPSGVIQINIRVPAGVTSRSAAAIELRAGTFEIPAGVTLAIR